MAEDVMTITPLGSGQEVGRSCHVLEFRDMNIMLDCGIHPGYEGMNGLPFLDRIEPERIDILLITHFHLDHAASLPYFTERTGFKGRIFMTHPTKAVIRLLLGDYLRLLQMRNAKSEEVLYTEAELLSCIEKIELIDYHQTVTVKGLTFYALNAGHVLGACMYWLDIGDGYLNPFAFTFIQNLKSIDLENFDDSGPSVVFASPGMLQSGVSRQLFDRWATDPKNGVLIAGYAVEHTLAKEIMNQPKEVVTLEGRRQPLNCLVDYVSFSAHVDFVQNRSFIAQVDPKHIILVHGQKDEMGRLKSALMLQYRQLPENKRPTITMPRIYKKLN
ncbi:Pre-mRNA 3'-end-processing endonuclease polyadenylation factor C-term [Fragilaria crotonensis]|nr:Pre-mRNA 3'-end-processing endonuclease polyadenylation factor C-term [Fragilaria crotonensis]